MNTFTTHGNRGGMSRLLAGLSVMSILGVIAVGSAGPALAVGVGFNPYPGISISAASSTVQADSDTTASITGLQADSPNATDNVPVELSVDSGSLQLGTTTGLTFYPSSVQSGASISFAGTRTEVNAALSSLVLTKDSTDAVTLTATIWDPTKDFTCDTGHFYRVVDTQASYADAKAQAQAALSGNGYLVTPTTESENTCVYNNIVAKADSGTANISWIGAISSYSAPTVTYSWDGGPEAGVAFWEKTANATGTAGSSINSAYANWDVETIGANTIYQPNAYVTGSTIVEPCVVYYKQSQDASTWHDVGCGGGGDYTQFVIEGDNAELSTASITVNFGAAGPTEPTMPNTGLTTISILLGVMLAGALLVAAMGSFSAQGRLMFASRRDRLVGLLRSADESLKRLEDRDGN